MIKKWKKGGVFSPKRLFKSFAISLDGIKSLMCYEVSFKQEVIMAGIALVVGLFLVYLKLAWFYFLPLAFSVALVLIVEALNTGIEAIADLVTEEQNELAKYAKDAGSAAVFISIVFMFFTWFIVLWKGL